MRIKKKLVVLFSIGLMLAMSSPAFACACCVERGFYSLTNNRPNAFYLGILESMKFAGPAEFYMSVAGFDGTKGLAELEKDEAAGKSIALDVVESFANRTWTLDVKTGGGRAGTLRLPMPTRLRQFKVDIDGVDNGLGVSLYKEFSATGTVRSATGIFRHANRNTKYTLLFQGRGNGCDDVSDFTRWRLELDGPSAEYAFFGKLVQP
jgi:hypothetical protein